MTGYFHRNVFERYCSEKWQYLLQIASCKGKQHFLSKGEWTFCPTLRLSIDTHIASKGYKVGYFEHFWGPRFCVVYMSSRVCVSIDRHNVGYRKTPNIRPPPINSPPYSLQPILECFFTFLAISRLKMVRFSFRKKLLEGKNVLFKPTMPIRGFTVLHFPMKKYAHPPLTKPIQRMWETYNRKVHTE